MRRILLTTISVLALFATSASAQSRIPWLKDVGQAFQEAKLKRRLVLLHFWDHGCPPCQTLERRVLNRPEVIRALATNYVPVKINVSENGPVARRFRVQRWPTDIILDSSGRELHRGISSQNPNFFVQTLDKVAASARAGRRTIEDSVLHNSNSPATGRPLGADPTLNRNSGFPIDSAFPVGGTQPGASGMASGGPGAATRNSPNTAQTGPTDPLTQSYQPRTAQTNPRYGQQQFPARPRTVTNDYVPHGSSQFNVSGGNRSMTQGADSRRMGNPMPAQAASRSQPTGQAASGQQNQPGLDGFCPVKLHGSDTEPPSWQKGDPQFGIQHRGKVYLFCCARCLELFKTNPDRYAPILSGYDVVSYVERGQLVPGKRAHGLSFRGHVYLFASEATLDQFVSRRAYYADAAQKALNRRQ